MNNTDDKKPNNFEPQTPDQSSDNGVQKTPEDAIKEPTTKPELDEPVPAQDEILPPLKDTLGGDDVVTPMEKK
jgi:hypothetical protein